MSEITVDHVSKQWGTTRAVDDISFTAQSGRFLVLLGPSGCGKSTTLRLIAGLEEPSAGTITIAGRDVTQTPPAERQLSMVFQSYALFPHLNVAENVAFGLKVRRVAAAERRRRLNRVIELVGLGQQLDRKPAELSGGQRQRVALARALVAENPILLMDEPLSNLDAQLRHDMRVEIRDLQQGLGVTVVYVTHDQIEAMSMADHVILLRDGQIEQSSAPEILYSQPATMTAARFIGTPPMNLLALADGPDGVVVAGSDGPTVLSGTGSGLCLGVRPEDIRLDDQRGLPAVVISSDYHGADTIIKARIGDSPILVRLPGRYQAAEGERLRLYWPEDAVHLFDVTSGERCVKHHWGAEDKRRSAL
jgi:sn-glycerol 3-phosphate transport system ATP-binding protein